MKRFVFAAVMLAACSLFAADEPKKDAGKDAKPAAAAEKPPEPAKFVKQHKIKINGNDFAYTTTSEEIFLKDNDGKNTASFFTIAYTKDGVAHPEDRPITFVFNGGPGSASVWLHFGLVGPRVVDIPSDAKDPGAPPYKLRDNGSTILRATDLVFVDPVGTGYSHAMGDKKGEDFWGYDEDADSVAEFIRTFITEHDRWNSPKFILGESYGGIRSSMLVPRLQGNLSVGLNGVILISPAINMGTLPFVVQGNDLTYATHLPALAAAAFYHHKVPNQTQWKDRETFLREVEKFAGSEYLTALFQGDKLPKAEKERIAEKMHGYIGLSKEYIYRSDLRVYAIRFIKELLRDEGRSIGLLDGRYAQDELDLVAEFPDSDPFSAKTGPIYISTFQSYLKNDLGVDWTKQYHPQNGEANQKWKRPANRRGAFAGFVDVTGALAQGTKDNEALRVFAAAGYDDLTTSYFATRYMLEHSGIDTKRMTIKTYDGGHMMYLYRPSQDALSNDIVAFIEGK
ncbi:MAG TPA: peptidase S10 [Thermoanaerobaculia bacterium]|nr:peptidase S10 [Thermoanaerobaculia bacterium]